MDPQSVSFTPQSDIWRLTMTETMRSVQGIQQDHAERLLRLERRHDGDARIKSVWGGGSPFPSGLAGTPQTGPQSASNVDFNDFDDEESPNNMVRSLHLDGDDEPRRVGAASRANSVRFDESAKWNHGSRSSVDLLSRTPSNLGGIGGGHPMFERTTSHKSDGRQSSAGHSASGRANSMGLESSQVLSHSATDLPGLAPGLALLGTVPSIIRCWLNDNFRHESLLYAAICTGSYKSWIDMKLLENLGLAGQVRLDVHENPKIRLPVYLPEAVSHPASSRPNSPAPQLPSITIDFNVLDRREEPLSPKAIQVFLGSDMLQQRQADVLLSTNTITLYDDSRSKLSIPLVRPENVETFQSLAVMNATTALSKRGSLAAPPTPSRLTQESIKSLTNGISNSQKQTQAPLPQSESEGSLVQLSADKQVEVGSNEPESTSKADEQPPQERKPSLPALITTRSEKDTLDDSQPLSSSSRTSTSPAVWGNWRTGGTTSGDSWASTSTRASSATYQRPTRDLGIKVLKPSTSRQPSRTSATTPQSAAPQSRFIDDGRHRAGLSTGTDDPQLRRPTSSENGKDKATGSTLKDKTRNANPVGGASAFGWLTSGQK